MTEKHRHSFLHGLAFVDAVQDVDAWMEAHCTGQVAMLTAEDTPRVKMALQQIQQSFQGDGRGYAHENTQLFVSRTIVDSINFAIKHTSPIMQMSDHLAFITRRALTGCEHARQLYRLLEPAIYHNPQRRDLSVRGVLGAG